ncbi:condensation domain-containing protein [Bacillus wiedmannii]|uniref:condensation domain-containing protein n=1 Tax=Bacillus wiedmannii TaxID=1890302 RepID=UPI000BEFFABA|nr:condensation domain-containing protein [Bacillus wiedmannii]PEM23658.1 hypothetical protein CN617_26775 [Bacillus wiedmannii]
MDVAIVGMSGLFPGARDLKEFYTNLLNEVDGVGEVPSGRSSLGSDSLMEFGYLDQIDEFDYKFFNLSRSEAEHMDPHQRILLQLVCAAIEHAGYSLKEMNKTKTAVILSALGGPKAEYSDLIGEYHPTILTGNAYPITAGRISYLLGLLGPSMMIDTSCSSSLVAVHEACNKLKLGESDFAIAGGIRLLTNLEHEEEGDFVLEAQGGRCRAFDDSADGIVGGEGGGIVFLKPLEEAIKDGDMVYAVIKGSSVNQDGDRSNGMTAPSPEAQSDVLMSAWRKSNIAPRTIGYIEAHGTGTRLGDPIEIQGLIDAFRKFTLEKDFCYIGSLKTNIGHLGEAAGVAGLIKAVLSIHKKVFFKSLHYVKPNKYIDITNSPVKVSSRTQQWHSNKNEKRRAGVSAFGLSGTNVHVVLEEAPKKNIQTQVIRDDNYLFTISAKSILSLSRYKKDLIDHLSQTNDEYLSNVAYVLNRGRDDHSYRQAFVARSKDELIHKLKSDEPMSPCQMKRPIVFLFSNEISPSNEVIQLLVGRSSICKSIYEDILKCGFDMNNLQVKRFTLQYLLCKYWISIGVHQFKLIGTGLGSIVTDCISGNIDLETALTRILYFPEESTFDKNNFIRYVNDLYGSSCPIFLSMSSDGELLNALTRVENDLNDLVVLSSYQESTYESILHVQSKLYAHGAEFKWEEYYKGEKNYRVELPTYSFDPHKCWIENVKTKEIQHKPNFSIDDEKGRDTPRRNILNTKEIHREVGQIISEIWNSNLKLECINENDNFFDVGGNSLIGIHIIEELEERFEIQLDFDVLFEYSTINELSHHIKELLQEQNPHSKREVGQIISEIWNSNLKLECINENDDFFDVGGNSLIGIHIIEELEKRFEIQLDFDILFEYSTINELSHHIKELLQEQDPHSKDRFKPISTITSGSQSAKVYPLSYSQEGIWYLQQLNPESSFYNVPFCFKLHEKVDVLLLERCIKELISRHEILRTFFVVKEGIPHAHIKEDIAFSMPVYDFQDMIGSSELESNLKRIRDCEFFEPFNLEVAPLLKVTAIKLGENEYEILVCMHHIITDDWSMQVFLKELLELYRAYSNGKENSLKELQYHYSDFSVWQRNDGQKKIIDQLQYWEEELKGAPDLLQLSIQKKRPQAQTFQGGNLSFSIPSETVVKLKHLSSQCETTLFMTLFAGFQALLYRYSGQEDITVGVPVAGRNISNKGVIGNFVNSLAIRTILSNNPTFEGLLGSVREDILKSFKHMDVPFNLVIEKLNLKRKLSHTPLYQIMFDFHHNLIARDYFGSSNLGDLDVVPLDSQVNTVRCDLEVLISMESEESLEGIIFFNLDIYDGFDVENLMRHYVHLLKEVSNDKKINLLDIKLVENDLPHSSNAILMPDCSDDFSF